MGTITSSTFVSLDGVINHMDKWHFDYVDAESDALALEQLREATAMLMGRATYEVYAGAWPGRDGAYAETINAIPKYVASTTLTEPTWETRRCSPATWSRLPEASASPSDAAILMHGYGPAARTLLAADLLDVLHLWVHPPAGRSRSGRGPAAAERSEQEAAPHRRAHSPVRRRRPAAGEPRCLTPERHGHSTGRPSIGTTRRSSWT